MEKTKKIPTSYKEFMEMLAASNAKFKEELAESHAKFEKELEESRKEYNARQEKLDERMDQMRERLDGLGLSNGLVAEDIIYNALGETLQFGGYNFDEAIRGYTRLRKLKNGKRVQGEYDIVMINGDCVAVIEVKYRVRKEDVIKLVQKQSADFKTVCPEYKNHKILLGIGGLAFETGAEKEALENGVGTFKLDGDAVKINDKNLKAY